ncbi:MAG: CBS domain-containing protein [Gammaproteobacteria bacterium]|nr:CBS domain-containing protein [Gammaproteobacteria bacterium]
MKATNRLTLSFLREHPQDAAQFLQRLPLDMQLPLLLAVTAEDAASLLEHFLPISAAACIQGVEPSQAARLLTPMPVRSSARIMAVVKQSGVVQPILNLLPRQSAQRIRQSLRHPSATVGAIMDRDYFALPNDISVAEAIKRLQRSDKPISGEIYIISPNFKLSGMIDLDSLFKAGRQLPLRSVMSRHSPSVSVHARIKQLSSRQEWQHLHYLAVVDTEGELVGMLHYPKLLQAAGETTGDKPTTDAFGSMLSIAGLYWIAIAELVDAIMSGRFGKSVRPNKRHP